MDALSAALAIELGPRGLTSNVIAPGPIAGTEGMERLARKEDVPAAMKMVPSGRYGTVKEIADATVYVFSDAGNFVNGATVVGEFLLHPFFPSSLVWVDCGPECESWGDSDGD